MAEDAIGWTRFSFRDNLIFNIANQAAVEASAHHLTNQTAGAARANSQGLDNAAEAVREAILRKYGPDANGLDDGQNIGLTDDYAF